VECQVSTCGVVGGPESSFRGGGGVAAAGLMPRSDINRQANPSRVDIPAKLRGKRIGWRQDDIVERNIGEILRVEVRRS
jgi:hypothetical protein